MGRVVITAANASGKISGAFDLAVLRPSVPEPEPKPYQDGIDPIKYKRVVVGKNFTGDVNLTKADDGTCYVDCEFRGGMVKLTGCTRVAFLRPKRQGGSGDDRGFRLSNEGRCTDIVFEGGFVRDIPWDGFSVAGDPVGGEPFHRDVRILGVEVDNTGLAGIDGGLRHGVYAWGPVEIAGCVFKRSKGGNAISCRGGGWIRGNYIDGAQESGIAYYADHPAPAGAEFIVERNVIVGVNTTSSGTPSNASDSCIYLKNVKIPANLLKTFRIHDNVVDRANGVRVHASYRNVAGLSITESGTLQVSPAVARKMFPA